jgi:translation initiation factor 2B subunit (eIF-2B alpha/beta/delta family)
VTDGNPDRLPEDVAAAIQAIRDDREHGASWLAQAAARTLLLAVETADDEDTHSMWPSVMRETAQALVAARPSMAAVANAAARIWSAGQGESSAADTRPAMMKLAERLAAPDESQMQAILAIAEKLVSGCVYTISRSGTVEMVLRALGQKRVVERALVAESRPGGEGVALAHALAASGIAVTLVADAACGVFIGEADCVVLGADSLRANGDVVNKVGSYPLALAAREAGMPVYVLCETLKIAAPQFPLRLEENDPRELLLATVPNLTARNPYFDVTPASLVAAYITEAGILDRETVARQAEVAGQALALLQADR